MMCLRENKDSSGHSIVRLRTTRIGMHSFIFIMSQSTKMGILWKNLGSFYSPHYHYLL